MEFTRRPRFSICRTHAVVDSEGNVVTWGRRRECVNIATDLNGEGTTTTYEVLPWDQAPK